MRITLIPQSEFARVNAAGLPRAERLGLFADMCRANVLATVKRAGSGHLGSSLSCLDVLVWLYDAELNTLRLGVEHPDRDVFFSSKGHDVPGQYAVLYAHGILPRERFINLRRLGGTHGHPDLSVPGIEANTGSLGMGISKAKGIALAKRLAGRGGRVFVMTGDGELHEGQIWESLQTAAHQGVSNICAIVDHNKIQTDLPVERIIGLRDLPRKLEAFGWHVERCDGHDYGALAATFARLARVTDRPRVLIADTIKGKGISFMEGPRALAEGGDLYRWHSGAPDDDAYEAGYHEILTRIEKRLAESGLGACELEEIETRERARVALKQTAERVVTAYGEELLALGGRHPELVVLDADLSADCGLRPFEQRYPERFIENGIAEQDMVSAAGGLALHGFLPVVNSFGVFLASRANEQIYNNATEGTKIVYACHYAGLIPAGPGKSHQSLRDISLFGALPDCPVLEPCNAVETRQALAWCVEQAPGTCMMRLAIGPSPRTIALPPEYALAFGRGCVLAPGRDAALFAYGPVLLHEALLAAERLEKRGVSLRVVNLPWLNRVDPAWLAEALAGVRTAIALDDHSPFGGLGDNLLNGLMRSPALASIRLVKLGVEGSPACGTPAEVLRAHGLDGESIADRIAETLAQGAAR
jgi:transketolase